MTQKVTFKISAAAAPYIGADKPRQERLKAATGQVKLPPTDFVLLVYYLCHDPDAEVKQAALTTLRSLPVSFLTQLLGNRELHPNILDALVQLHFRKGELVQLFVTHPMLSEKSARFLAEQSLSAAPAPTPQAPQPAQVAKPAQPQSDQSDRSDTAAAPEDDQPVDEESAEFQSKYQMAQNMGVADKIKMAMTGDKEWRTLLIKDTNKLVSGAAIKNPRMTENEVLAIAKSQVQNDEIMRVICANKEWVKNPQIRKALVENHKTPLPNALRFMQYLSEKDLAHLAKSKNVSTVIATQARRLLLSKKEGR
ncbi:hypothetical protein [Geomonas sp.]|uniref:hypothetical protein n=1 Tax=Geomonas sp. TaxID=2651584 RepID=UPI002B473329|nr:hypothetical protein [Geomonas sp.]HJV33830.1 hypothetical protein [Geomonas sp.]